MKGFKGTIVIKPEEGSKVSVVDIGEHIHSQLVGNQDYVNSNIGISMANDEVFIWVDELGGEMPEIKL